MVQESNEIKREECNIHLDEVSCNINEEEQNSYHSFNIDKTGEQNKDRNLFGPRLLFCSILLWSLLFIKESDFSRVHVNRITKMITEQIEIEPVQQIVNKLTVAIQQII